MPRVSHLSSRYSEPLNGYHRASTPRKKHSSPGDLPVITSGLVPVWNQANRPTKSLDPVRNLVDTRCQRKTQMRAECLRQSPCEDRLSCLPSPTHSTLTLSHESANVALELIQRNQSGDGCASTFNHHGNRFTGVQLGGLQHTSDDMVQSTSPAELTNGRESGAWFAGQWADVKEEYRHPDLSALRLYSRGDLTEPFATLSPIQRLFHRMIYHVIRTLHRALLALTTLRSKWDDTVLTQSNERPCSSRCLFTGASEVTHGSERIFVIVCKALYCAWRPIQTILSIIRWCVVEQ